MFDKNKKMKNLLLSFMLIVTILAINMPSNVYGKAQNFLSELFIKSEEQIYLEKQRLSKDELINEIQLIEIDLEKEEDQIVLLPHVTALLDKKNQFSKSEIKKLLVETDSDSVIESALIKMYVDNKFENEELLDLLSSDYLSKDTKEYFFSIGEFDSAELEKLYYEYDDEFGDVIMKRFLMADPNKAQKIAVDGLLNIDSMYTNEKIVGNLIGSGNFVKNNKNYLSRSDIEKIEDKIIDVYYNSDNELVQDQAIYALSNMCDFDVFTNIIGNDEYDFLLKVSAIEKNVKVILNKLESKPTEEELVTILKAMNLHPISDVGDKLETLDISSLSKNVLDMKTQTEIFIKNNGVEGVFRND